MPDKYVISNGNFKCVADTGKAILIKDTRTKYKFWIPKGCISRDSQITGINDWGTIRITEKIAIEKGITFKKTDQTPVKKKSISAMCFADCVCTNETEKELQVYIPEIDGEICVKKSRLLHNSRILHYGDRGTLVISRSYAKTLGLV